MDKKNKSLFWTKEMDEKFKESVDNFWKNCLSDSLINKYNEVNSKYLEANKSYKLGHNKVKYGFLKFLGLPLSFIVIIPFYWAWKKYKKLNQNKLNLEEILKKCGENKLLVNHEIISKIDFDKLEADVLKTINYKNMGPINQNLIDEIKSLSLFDYEDERNNPFRTSWGIFEENKIVINNFNQKWETYMKEYSGSITVTREYINREGRIDYRHEVITAYYSHPAEKIYYGETYYTFMESCSSLELRFIKPLNKLFSKKSDKSKASFENPKFDKLADWEYNNDTQIRMLFSILAQENFVKEIEYIKDDSIPNRYRFCKDKSFFYNLDDVESSEKLLNKVRDSVRYFSNDYSIELDSFKNIINKASFDSLYAKFESMIYLWMIPLFKSEDHSLSIKRCYDNIAKNGLKLNKLISYYIYNTIFRHKAVIGDIDTFHKIIDVQEKKVNKSKVYITTFKGTSFNKHKKIKYIWTRGHNVPVEYVDYIKTEGLAYLACIELKNIKNDIPLDNNIRISNNILSMISNDEISNKEIEKLIDIKNKLEK